jgi:hypothetical protein
MACTEKDDFEKLIDLCVESFNIVYNDSVALDANGVIGKMRVLIVANDRYQRETRKAKARRTIDELSEVNDLMEDVDSFGSVDETTTSEAPDVTLDDDDYDIRGAIIDKSKGKKGKGKKEMPKTEVSRPARFDKAKLDMRLKLLQQRRDILSDQEVTEDQEQNALNIFFIAVTREEFEELDTVEISEGSSSAPEAFDTESTPEQKAALGATNSRKGKIKESVSYHTEMVDGELIEVGDE